MQEITTKNIIVCDVTPYSPVDVHGRFGVACEGCRENRGSTFLRNVGKHLPEYMTYPQEDSILQLRLIFTLESYSESLRFESGSGHRTS
jgi:hypothetical protein